ncbi:uncharacterized protein C2845_PM01G43870 [Panicum miliaceum]|uniref:Uncharacterized protein n=1 Tax=Panicum miliaceum TaxID=4540 RepID=A0A3L6TG76_PANMI|nr:uncharacterized protein C2845_PM01G43870 [Panicum miliaceum]
MAAAGCGGRRRFAVACGVLSRCVRAEAEAGTTATPTAEAQAPAAASSTTPPCFSYRAPTSRPASGNGRRG